MSYRVNHRKNRPHKFIGLIFGVLFSINSLAAPYTFSAYDPTVNITTIQNKILPTLRQPLDIKNNLMSPMMGTKQLTTLNNTSFNAQLSCPSSQSYLTVTSINDLQNEGSITITGDTNMDGITDYNYTPQFKISGVCSNGVVSCNPGTWQACQSYDWTANSVTKQLSLQPSLLSNMAGCYCINNSCGGKGLNDAVLSDVGGASVAALTAIDPLVSVTKAITIPGSISFNGQDTRQCGQISPTTNLSQYFTNPRQLTTDAASASVNDAAFNKITSSSIATNSVTTTQTCSVQRNVAIDEVTIANILQLSGGTYGLCGADCISIAVGNIQTPLPVVWATRPETITKTLQLNILRPDRVLSAKLVSGRVSGYLQIADNAVALYTKQNLNTFIRISKVGSYMYLASDFVENLDLSANFKTGGVHTLTSKSVTGAYAEGYAVIEIRVDATCKLGAESISDGCTALASDNKCQLFTENVDGTLEFDNYNPTGVISPSSQKNIVGNACTLTATAAWWQRNKSYHCKSNQNFNFDNVYQRSSTVQDSAATGAGSYNDFSLNKSTGSWGINAGNAISGAQVTGIPSCTQACKTEKTIAAKQISLQGTQGNLLNNPVEKEVFYHECLNNVCPIGQGEAIVTACGCLDNFGEATAIMQAFRLAGTDLICSTGTAQPIQ